MSFFTFKFVYQIGSTGYILGTVNSNLAERRLSWTGNGGLPECVYHTQAYDDVCRLEGRDVSFQHSSVVFSPAAFVNFLDFQNRDSANAVQCHCELLKGVQNTSCNSSYFEVGLLTKILVQRFHHFFLNTN